MQQIWKQKQYYSEAENASKDKSHPAMKTLLKYAFNKKKILDLGCGEGTRLLTIAKNKVVVGIDISPVAIRLAKQKLPSAKLLKADITKTGLKSNSFDLIYSFFVLEHVNNPQKAVNEAMRLLKRNGVLILAAPNYGAPNRRSPVSNQIPILKLVTGFTKDLLVKGRIKNLNWSEVIPTATNTDYTSDSDTVVEPYVYSLIMYLKYNNLKILEYKPCWSEELEEANIMQRVFQLLSKHKIFPFTYWGPHFVVVACKK